MRAAAVVLALVLAGCSRSANTDATSQCMEGGRTASYTSTPSSRSHALAESCGWTDGSCDRETAISALEAGKATRDCHVEP